MPGVRDGVQAGIQVRSFHRQRRSHGSGKFSGIVTAHQHLIALRRNEYGDTTGLTSGEIAVLGSDENFKILTYQRGANKHPVIVVASFNGHRVSDYALPLPEGEWKIRFNSSWKGYSTDFAELKADK